MKLIADIALIHNGEALLVRYKDGNKYDHQHGWFLPDDALAEFEHPDDAAKRILKEQVGMEIEEKTVNRRGLTAVEPQLAFIESFKGKDKSWHLVFHYRLDLDDAAFDALPDLQAAIEQHPDLAAAGWFKLDELPPRREVAHGGWALDILSRI